MRFAFGLKTFFFVHSRTLSHSRSQLEPPKFARLAANKARASLMGPTDEQRPDILPRVNKVHQVADSSVSPPQSGSAKFGPDQATMSSPTAGSKRKRRQESVGHHKSVWEPSEDDDMPPGLNETDKYQAYSNESFSMQQTIDTLLPASTADLSLQDLNQDSLSSNASERFEWQWMIGKHILDAPLVSPMPSAFTTPITSPDQSLISQPNQSDQSNQRTLSSPFKPVSPFPESPAGATISKKRVIYREAGADYAKYLGSQLRQATSIKSISKSYLQTSLEPPSKYPSDILITSPTSTTASNLILESSPPEDSKDAELQRHLLVLDLNGTLLYRTPYRRYGPRMIWPRPYLECLLQYLSHEKTRNTMIREKVQKKNKYWVLPPPSLVAEPESTTVPDVNADENIPRKKRKRSKRNQSSTSTSASASVSMVSPDPTSEPDPTTSTSPFISEDDYTKLRKRVKKHLKRSQKKDGDGDGNGNGNRKSTEGQFTILAPMDAMIWSSVQPLNLLKMLGSAFRNYQGAFVACWTRGMLGLASDEYWEKTQVTKDLERIWWSSQEQYSARSTVILDDSPRKLRLQPWNLLDVPEYIAPQDAHLYAHDTAMAAATAAATATVDGANVDTQQSQPQPQPRQGQGQEQKQDTEAEAEAEASEDKYLLAVIGILEESRARQNVPAWIRSGGLWAGFSRPKSTSTSASSSRSRSRSRSNSPSGEIAGSTSTSISTAVAATTATTATATTPATANETAMTTTTTTSAARQESDDSNAQTKDTPEAANFWYQDPTVLEHWCKKGRQALLIRGIPLEVGPCKPISK